MKQKIPYHNKRFKTVCFYDVPVLLTCDGIFTKGEYSYRSPLVSELPTASLGMRTHVANATVSKSVHRLGAKKEGLPQGKSFFFGRSGGTRTHGLQYPKLARYHLRYASKSCYQICNTHIISQDKSFVNSIFGK